MDSPASQDMDGYREARWNGRDEDGEAAVLELFNDESRDKGLFDLDERRFPDVLPAFPRESLRETSEERVARKSLEERAIHVVPEDPANSRPNGRANPKNRPRGAMCWPQDRPRVDGSISADRRRYRDVGRQLSLSAGEPRQWTYQDDHATERLEGYRERGG